MHTIVRASLHHIRGRRYEAKILETFPNIDDPELEREIISEIHQYPTRFSKEALADAASGQSLKPGQRADLTHAVTVTIDGETAKDFDDAITVDRTKKGTFNLKVSIADVSFFVKEGSALDREAFARGTSVYFPDYCTPMLPEKLSNDLCSLVPNKPRNAITCELEISKTGDILKRRVYPSLIKSKARLTYTQVSKLIEKGKTGQFSPKIEEMLKNAHELSKIIRTMKLTRGYLDLDLPELQLDLDKFGNVKRVYQADRNEAHRLIEDFMIIANEMVSEMIEEAGYPSIFRVHEDPDPLKTDRLRLIAKKCGFSVSKKSDPLTALQNYLDSVRGHPSEKMLVVSALRSLKQAQYSPHNVGHFGLGSESYCHFTSPIRRYPDLMVHRILRRSNFLKNKEAPIKFHKLEEIAESCSETERRAFMAERDMQDIKKCRFMAQYVGKKFEGLVTSTKSFGVFVEIIPHLIEGLVHVRTLPYDYWNVDELETTLKGSKSGIVFGLGDRVKVQLIEVDRLRREITLRYISHIKSGSAEPKRAKKKQKK